MKASAWGALVAMALLLLFGSTYVVQQGHGAILFNLGRVVRADVPPGLHFKWPLIESAQVYDKRTKIIAAQAERYLTSENKDVSIDFFVLGRIADLGAYYRATGGDEAAAEARLAPIIKDSLRNEINSRTLSQVVSGSRSDVVGRQMDTINRGAATLGIKVVDIGIKQIDLPQDSDVIKNVYRRMSAQRQQVASKLRAEGEEQALTITSKADADSQIILADAERDAQQSRGEGDAQAAKIYGDAAAGDPSFYAFQRSLEAYRKAFADGNSVIVLERNDPFLKYMQDDK